MLNYLKSLGSDGHLSLIQLSRNLTALMLLFSGQRGQVLTFLDIRRMTFTDSTVVFRIGDLLKTSRPGYHNSELCFESYAPNQLICVYTTIVNFGEDQGF